VRLYASQVERVGYSILHPKHIQSAECGDLQKRGSSSSVLGSCPLQKRVETRVNGRARHCLTLERRAG
jgi:hypothetical protein